MSKSWTGPTSAHQKAQREIAHRLSEVGFVLPGSLTVRSCRCGKPRCSCHADPPRLHGPYAQWTRRHKHLNLTTDQHADYQQYFDNAKELRNVVRQLETLTLSAIENDPRFANRTTPTGHLDESHH